MSTNSVPSIDYTSRDFLTIKEALKVHLQTKFPNDWRDFYESNVGIALMDMIAYSHDVLSFFLDYTANEVFLPTARDRLSLLLLGRLVGYQLRTATSASVVCKATLPSTYLEAVIIPAGTKILSTNGVDFLTTEDTRIEAGQLTGNITFTQGVSKSDNFSSDGSVFQKFILTQSSVVQGTLEVTVDGDEWTEVDSLAYSDANSQNFSVSYDETGVATIMFGDGTSGRVPVAGAVISVTYRIGGGISGNVTLNQISGTVQGQRELIIPAAYVTVTVLNDTYRGSGGEDAETIEHAKLWIPAWVRANNRAVTESDYDALGNAFSDPTYGAPAFTKAKLKQEIPELNTVEVYVWARDGGGDIVTPSQGLKDAISTYFNNTEAGGVRMICTHTEVLDGNLVYIDISVAVRIVSSYAQTDVLAAIQSAVDNLFSASSNVPGADFRLSALYEAIHALAGVEYCLVRQISASYLTTELIGLGNGITPTFSSTLTLEPGTSVRPKSVRMYYGAEVEVLTDDGDGNLLNPLSVVVGSIDYVTGAITGTFTSAPAVDVSVYTEFRYELDYQRGEEEGTGDGLTQRFRGVIDYPPVNPYDVVSGQKGIAFSDGTQVITDDGDGHLIGSVDPTGTNTINYTTGAYDLTFLNPPANGATIRSTYRQLLETDSQDLPLDKDQLAVQGVLSVSILTS